MSSDKIHPAIVVSAYNRGQSLLRLLASLQQAEYPQNAVTLVISIDGGENTLVAELAQRFEWTHGEKKIIRHQDHLGLRAHILACGDLTKEYGSIILFEDDLFASKYFYSFAMQALKFYSAENLIAGVSLYSYDISESGFNPFAAVDDGNDVYFMQVASSWGQAWTSGQWQGFRQWFQQHPELTAAEHPPAYLLNWSENSWKKHFIRYLHFTGKYFVFPRHSLSTNFEEPGATASTKGLYQVAVQQAKQDYHFSEFTQSLAVYDAYFEMTASCLKQWNQQLSGYDFTTDIYGKHPTVYCNTPYLLTTKKANNPALTFGMEMFPPLLNVLNKVPGDAIKLVKREDIANEKVPDDLSYYKYKAVSEIIFQEELIQRIEKVHAENSINVQKLHSDYTAKMEQINGQIRSLHKDYHARIEQLHRAHEENVKTTVAEALKAYQFNIDYPAFAICTIVNPEDTIDAALHTARSVQQQNYPRLHHQLIFIGDQREVDFNGFTSTTAHTVKNAAEAWETAQTYFNAEGNEFHCLLRAGTVLLPKALATVREIFLRFAEVNWLKGLPAQAGNNGEMICATHTIDYRWDKNRFFENTLAEIENKISASAIFWKKHLWQKTGGRFDAACINTAAVDLFARLFQKDYLYVAMAYLSVNRSEPVPSPAAEAEFALLQKNFPQRSGFQKMTSDASYPLFQRDIPYLRAIHKSRSHYPPLIRFDYDTQSFYLSEY